MKEKQKEIFSNSPRESQERQSPNLRGSVKYTYECKNTNSFKKKTELNVSQILIDPEVVDKAGALSIYIKNNPAGNALTNYQIKSVSPITDKSLAKSAASDLVKKRNQPQYISNFNRLRSPQDLSRRAAGIQLDSTRQAQERKQGGGSVFNYHHIFQQIGSNHPKPDGVSKRKHVNQSEVGGVYAFVDPLISTRLQISEHHEPGDFTKRNMGTSMLSGDLFAGQFDVSATQHIDQNQSRQNLIILQNAQMPYEQVQQLRGGEQEQQKMQGKQLVPNLDWSKVGIGHDNLLQNR